MEKQIDSIKKSLIELYKFLNQNYSRVEISSISEELIKIISHSPKDYITSLGGVTYEDIQLYLARVNEKEQIRKSNGVYYTSNDVVKFIYSNSIKALYGTLRSSNLHVQDLNGIPYRSFSYCKTVFDPTCGAGEFLLVALSIKLDLIDLHQDTVSPKDIRKVVRTIFGNDINPDSIVITKLRLFLYILNRHGVDKIAGIADELNKNFGCYDFINLNQEFDQKFDIIIGNPPYVEDSKCDTAPKEKYGNVYANVLSNVSTCLAPNGVMGFIIPLSYVATPRMKRIRETLNNKLSEQYILSYCDRPDCLFPSVHQKLCILIGKYNEESTSKKIYTSNYHFWYKEERDTLFTNAHSVLNRYVFGEYIPKIGTKLDASIFRKVTTNRTTLYSLLSGTQDDVYLNMRAAFWIKAFRNEHVSGEYKRFKCNSAENANLCMCILNSSLFWWYWICVSDCWHITNKELNGFTVPHITNDEEIKKLATKLEKKLEQTKIYVGTKQTEYEYKHKECTQEIHDIDDLICESFGLTEEETLYIKNFALRYRVSGGVSNENN